VSGPSPRYPKLLLCLFSRTRSRSARSRKAALHSAEQRLGQRGKSRGVVPRWSSDAGYTFICRGGEI
jgi:hypothetical protein